MPVARRNPSTVHRGSQVVPRGPGQHAAMDTLAPRRHPPQPDVSPHRRSDAGWCWGAAHRETVLRLLRYSAVSLVSTSTSVVTLGVLVGLAGTPATLANVIATAVGTVP